MNLERRRFLPDGLGPNRLPRIPDNFWGRIFKTLWERWGDPYWWPGSGAWEVAAGAILTQNTAWTNVERALAQLEECGWNGPEALLAAPVDELAEAVRPSGYYNVKARKLRELAKWWLETGRTAGTTLPDDDSLRDRLLAVWGVGPETADSIACYALGRPFFVVDAYTIRTVVRMRDLDESPGYDELQEEVHRELPRDTMLFNHLHGLLVVLGKEHCTARNPRCEGCPLQEMCIMNNKNR